MALQKIIRSLEEIAGAPLDTPDREASSDTQPRISGIRRKIIRAVESAGIECSENANYERWEESVQWRNYNRGELPEGNLADYTKQCILERDYNIKSGLEMMRSGKAEKIEEGVRILEGMQTPTCLDLDAALAEICGLALTANLECLVSSPYLKAKELSKRIREYIETKGELIYSEEEKLGEEAVLYFMAESDYEEAVELCNALLSLNPKREIAELRAIAIKKSGMKEELCEAIRELKNKYPESSIAKEMEMLYSSEPKSK
ncbi:MAG: hypothetical protein QXT20_00655 [Candidatus Woesearchaeota archaeon]